MVKKVVKEVNIFFMNMDVIAIARRIIVLLVQTKMLEVVDNYMNLQIRTECKKVVPEIVLNCRAQMTAKLQIFNGAWENVMVIGNVRRD